MKQQIITVCAIKGGVAKTATSGSIAEAARINRRKVLLIDLDPQAGASIWYGADLKRPGSYELVTGSTPAETIQPVKGGLYIASGGANLTALKTSPASAQRLKNALNALEDRFNFIVIDTGPGMTEGLNNALFASTGVIIPLEADSDSLQAYYQTLTIIKQVQASRPELKTKGVVITKYDGRPNVNRMLREAIKENCAADKIPYLGEIRQGVAIREARTTRTPLFDYAPKSKPAQDYAALYEKIKGAK